MTADDLRRVVVDELLAIAPDIDRDALDPDADLRDEYDLDSMDGLNLITALHERLGANIPEADAARLTTVNKIVAYLGDRQAVS
jgi:acyl carrier protein